MKTIRKSIKMKIIIIFITLLVVVPLFLAWYYFGVEHHFVKPIGEKTPSYSSDYPDLYVTETDVDGNETKTFALIRAGESTIRVKHDIDKVLITGHDYKMEEEVSYFGYERYIPASDVYELKDGDNTQTFSFANKRDVKYGYTLTIYRPSLAQEIIYWVLIILTGIAFCVGLLTYMYTHSKRIMVDEADKLIFAKPPCDTLLNRLWR